MWHALITLVLGGLGFKTGFKDPYGSKPGQTKGGMEGWHLWCLTAHMMSCDIGLFGGVGLGQSEAPSRYYRSHTTPLNPNPKP